MTLTLPKLLIADDNIQYLKSLERSLRNEFQLDCVTNADDEIAKVREAYGSNNRYSLIITDNQMEDGKELEPGDKSSGLYAIREIRKFDQLTPILLHTAYKGTELYVQAIFLGADAILSKPLDHKDFLEKYEMFKEGRK